jgi:hypothetical protein
MDYDKFVQQPGKPGDYGVTKFFAHPVTGEIGQVFVPIPGEVFEALTADLLAMIGPDIDRAVQMAVEQHPG